VKIFLSAEVLILVLALGIAVLRSLPGPVFFPLRAFAVVYVDLFRSVPTILVIYILGFGVPALQLPGVPIDPLFWGVVSLVLVYSAYVAEVYRAGIEWILGFRLRGTSLHLDPCIPRSWPRFEIDFRYHSSRYRLVVENPRGAMRGVTEISLDGGPVAGREIPLADDGREQRHEYLREDEDFALVAAVGEHAAEEHDDQARQRVREVHRAERELGVPQLEHEQALRDDLHPRPDERDRVARPDRAVVGLAEHRQRFGQGYAEEARLRRGVDRGGGGHGAGSLHAGGGSHLYGCHRRKRASRRC